MRPQENVALRRFQNAGEGDGLERDGVERDGVGDGAVIYGLILRVKRE